MARRSKPRPARRSGRSRRHGIELPHLCYSPEPGYRPDGNCRACMVEVEGERVLAASCIRKPTAGMKVRTATERAKTARRMVIELLLADQPPQDVAHDPESEFWQTGPTARSLRRAASPRAQRPRPTAAIRRWRSISMPASSAICACAPAARCRSTTSSAWPGAATREKIVFDFDDPMGASTCVACGECVQACPTGALMPATLLDDANVRTGCPDREVDSLCPYCGVGCQITYHIKDDKLALRRRPERAGQREPAVRQGPFRLRLCAPSRIA